MTASARWLLAAALLAASGPAAPAHADVAGPPWPPRDVRGRAYDDPAPADTTLGRYLRRLADSTDAYFGATAAPLDTAGLDSALATGLAQPAGRPRRPLVVTPGGWLGFNRVDGPVYGGSLTLGRASAGGAITGRLAWAEGPDDWLGGVDFRRRLRVGGRTVEVEVGGGYFTRAMNRDHPPGGVNLVRAFVTGRDYTHYLRRQGWRARLAHETPAWRAAIEWRDHDEAPIATSATWTLTGREPAIAFNAPAARGRARELALSAGVRWPLLRGWSEVAHWTSGDAIGSDFEYRRTRLASGFELPLGALASLVPQVEYGRLSGAMTPQAAFYLGGWHSIRSLHRDEKGGTGLALARVDLISSERLLARLGVPATDAFPVQVGLFAAAGAVWGADPYGGPAVAGLDWPNAAEWLPEAGVSLLYRPGLPDPDSYLRINYAVALGPREHEGRWSFQYTRALDLVTPFGD